MSLSLKLLRLLDLEMLLNLFKGSLFSGHWIKIVTDMIEIVLKES
jgi:hypothetical protein